MLARRYLVTLTLAGLYLTASPSANAQLAQASPPTSTPTQPKAAPPQTKPATEDEVATYMGMAAVNMCNLAQLKQPFKEALTANIDMVVTILTQKHGSQLPGITNKLTPVQIANGSALQIVARVQAFCGSSLSPEWKKEVDTLLSEFRKQAGAGSGTK
jgi:hypothetical protein